MDDNIKTNTESWGAEVLGVKLVLGFVFCAVLFWPVIFGVQRVWFVIEEGTPAELIKIELSKNEFNTKPHKGFLEITGYPQAQVSVDLDNPSYMEKIDATTYRSFYFTLQPAPDVRSPAPVIVERRESFSGIFGFYFESDRKKFPAMPAKDRPITVQGLAGYHLDGVSDDMVSAFWAQNVTISKDAILLVEGESPPSLKLTLLWFIPVSALFLTGLFLIPRWIYLLKKQY